MTSDAFRKFDLTGKTAVVTGGGTGLGYYMARGLARSGARVMIAARREDVLKESAARLTAESQGNEVLHHRLDLADRASVSAFTEHAIATMGVVDIFVGNAGIDCLEPIDNIKDESIDAMCQVNIAANVSLVRAFLPGMRKKKWGRILFSSSGTSVCASPAEGMGMYTAVKGALNAFTRTAAAEAGHDGITVNSIIFGIFDTEIVKDVARMLEAQTPGATKAFYDSFSSMIALGRWGKEQEVEGLVQFVASDAASYLTGANLVYDGGLTTMLRPSPPPESPILPQWI
jgi:NAD(P)-dependent dehydrogenase (short-subunit alcohol dehydrogenase family)